MKHENENMRMMNLVCFHWLISEIENDVPFLLLFLFMIDEECATMVTEPLQHEQPVQPQHQSKTVTHHACSHQTVPLIGLMETKIMMKLVMAMAMGMVPRDGLQGPVPLSKTCHSSAFPLQH